MRKKKLMEQISKLKSEKSMAENDADYWKDMVEQMTKGLVDCGVKTEIIFPEPELLECSSLECEERYIQGIADVPPTLQFDFTEHDANVAAYDGRDVEIIKTALAKQKAEFIGHRNGKTCCPRCGEPAFRQNYCDKCGQRLKAR